MAIVFQGNFQVPATGGDTYIPVPSGFDSVKVWNLTKIAAGGAGTGVIYEWRSGMADGTAISYVKLAADESMSPTFIATGGISAYNSSDNPVGPLVGTITAIAAGGVTPIVAAVAHGLLNGDVVRMINIVGGQQLGGIDFTIAEGVDADHFELVNMAAIVAATTGSFRKIKYQPIFYPRDRVITVVSLAANALVTLAVTHGYIVGQKVSFRVSSAFGMTQLDNLEATILAIGTADIYGSTNTITIDVDTTAFTPFVFPITTADAFTPAQVVPVGKDASGLYAMNLQGATYNTATRGFILYGGAARSGGSANDEIFFEATKSDNL